MLLDHTETGEETSGAEEEEVEGEEKVEEA